MTWNARRKIGYRQAAVTSRPFRVPGYPIVPILFALTALAIVVNTLVETPREATYGLAFIGLGIPVYYAQRAYRRRA